ncbi:MAG: transcriptional activator RfaH [Hyphomicrobium sp.]|nr:MAG: transcriptional activator RfaH [Hyphomicrobium sp.]
MHVCDNRPKTARHQPKALPWAVINTHPHREKFAMSNLQRQNFVAYCPVVRKTLRHARRSCEVLRPMFPGYMFVEINPDLSEWRTLLSTYGVRSLVRCGEKLAFIDASFIASLKAREINGAIVRPERPYRIGQQVRMNSGALEGLVATIIEMDEKDRLVVLLDFLNRPLKARLEAQAVTAV